MSYLERHDPHLFARFCRLRRHDRTLVEVFDDLETVARELDREDGTGALRVAGIVAELTQELRQRVAACEAAPDRNKEI